MITRLVSITFTVQVQSDSESRRAEASEHEQADPHIYCGKLIK